MRKEVMPLRRDQSRMWMYLSASILLLAFVLLAGTYSVITPAFESPDEVGHFLYIVHLVETRSLPVMRVGELLEAHQPPLYYLFAAVAALPADLDDPTGMFEPNPRFRFAAQGRNEVNIASHHSAETFPFQGQALALHLARGASILMGLVTVALTIVIGWRVFPHRPVIGLLAGALVAFNPQFLFISSSVNNDNLLTMVATIAWWQALRILERPGRWQQWVHMGALVALGVLAKLSAAVIGLVAGGVLIGCALQRRSLKLFVCGALAVVAAVIFIAGWWFARNQALYGDPLGWTMYKQVFAVNLRDSPLEWGDFRAFLSIEFRSFWGVFGWMNLPAPRWFYQAFRILCLSGLLGLGVFALRGQFSELSGFQKASLIVLAFAALTQEAFMIAVITGCGGSCYQGRYLFPVIGPLMIIVSLGLIGPLARHSASLFSCGLVAMLLGIAVFIPFRLITPAYETVSLPKWRLWFVPYKAEFTFGDMFKLRGYDLHVDTKSRVTLTLYWQALRRPDFNYSVFVHVIDGSDQLVGQKDHAPGENLGYPPIAWWPEDIIADEHIIELPSQLASGTYRFRVGVYDWSTGERLSVLKRDHIGDSVILAQALHH